MTTTSPRRGSQQGVMLLEALIGILIFSIGILALLSMQATAMRATVDAKYRSEAAFLANEIIGTMWVDRANLASYATASCAGYSECNNWMTRLQAKLPNATGANAPTIVIAGQQATVTILWQRPGETTISRHVAVAQINNS
jgi:type IV pilus assembly protein PilV